MPALLAVYIYAIQIQKLLTPWWSLNCQAVLKLRSKCDSTGRSDILESRFKIKEKPFRKKWLFVGKIIGFRHCEERSNLYSGHSGTRMFVETDMPAARSPYIYWTIYLRLQRLLRSSQYRVCMKYWIRRTVCYLQPLKFGRTKLTCLVSPKPYFPSKYIYLKLYTISLNLFKKSCPMLP